MKKYLCLFRIRFTGGLQYRAAALAGIATQFAWGCMELLLYAAFYRSNPAAFPMAFSQLSCYIWLRQAFLSLYASWMLDGDILAAITGGNIAYELARPMDLYNMWFVKNLAMRVSRAILRCAPILLVAVFLPAPYGLSLPASPGAAALVALTLILALFVTVAYCMLAYIATFYTLNPMGVRIVALSLADFFSGQLIPLPFLPDGLRRWVELTPFASMQNLPFAIYSGNLAGVKALWGVVLQIFWLCALVLAGRLWLKKAAARIVVQGG